jgi:hypothetical protein
MIADDIGQIIILARSLERDKMIFIIYTSVVFAIGARESDFSFNSEVG